MENGIIKKMFETAEQTFKDTKIPFKPDVILGGFFGSNSFNYVNLSSIDEEIRKDKKLLVKLEFLRDFLSLISNETRIEMKIGTETRFKEDALGITLLFDKAMAASLSEAFGKWLKSSKGVYTFNKKLTFNLIFKKAVEVKTEDIKTKEARRKELYKFYESKKKTVELLFKKANEINPDEPDMQDDLLIFEPKELVKK